MWKNIRKIFNKYSICVYLQVDLISQNIKGYVCYKGSLPSVAQNEFESSVSDSTKLRRTYLTQTRGEFFLGSMRRFTVQNGAGYVAFTVPI